MVIVGEVGQELDLIRFTPSADMTELLKVAIDSLAGLIKRVWDLME
jgi:hypothetical protein